MTVSEPWKAHVVRQLRRRDREQHHSFRELVCAYSRLLDRNSETDPILRGGRRGAAGRLKTTAGELACQVVERQQEVKIKEDILEAQRGRLLQEERHAAAARDARRRLRLGAERLGSENALLKSDYDALLERRSRTERRLHEEDLRGSRLLEDVIARKRQAAARLNLRNDRRSRARDANLQKDLQTAATFEVDVELEPFCLTLPKAKSSSLRKKFADKSQGRPLRSAPDSERSPRILASLRELFERRRGPNALTSEDRDRDPERAVRVPASARVPSRALHVLEAHEEGINTAAFCPGSARLASAGTDRVVKVWHVQAGALRHQSTLDGSTEGLTCVQFDPTGHRILAGSYDKSVLLWHLDRPVAKAVRLRPPPARPRQSHVVGPQRRRPASAQLLPRRRPAAPRRPPVERTRRRLQGRRLQMCQRQHQSGHQPRRLLRGGRLGGRRRLRLERRHRRPGDAPGRRAQRVRRRRLLVVVRRVRGQCGQKGAGRPLE
ncbi:beta-arrestin-1 isoform X6 [Syngnathoides biaculeatus]|uniref:beta-arrestin-1 isoform X6 n=1 Tax=Syngnathoides biaculeatus TaxID=300417 RepID=UPI002ADDE4F9|nr:beta-arrestin-1 isoform X6 [Syngnathoides biaculeatus]